MFSKTQQQNSDTFVNDSTEPILVGVSLENHNRAWHFTENLNCKVSFGFISIFVLFS